jgi:hypothetical protein
MTPQQRKRRAFTMTAELMLMQHTCHWFCRSRAPWRPCGCWRATRRL